MGLPLLLNWKGGSGNTSINNISSGQDTSGDTSILPPPLPPPFDLANFQKEQKPSDFLFGTAPPPEFTPTKDPNLNTPPPRRKNLPNPPSVSRVFKGMESLGKSGVRSTTRSGMIFKPLSSDKTGGAAAFSPIKPADQSDPTRRQLVFTDMTDVDPSTVFGDTLEEGGLINEIDLLLDESPTKTKSQKRNERKRLAEKKARQTPTKSPSFFPLPITTSQLRSPAKPATPQPPLSLPLPVTPTKPNTQSPHTKVKVGSPLRPEQISKNPPKLARMNFSRALKLEPKFVAVFPSVLEDTLRTVPLTANQEILGLAVLSEAAKKNRSDSHRFLTIDRDIEKVFIKQRVFDALTKTPKFPPSLKVEFVNSPMKKN